MAFFYLFSGLTLLGVTFVFIFCPEIKGVVLEDIENVFEDFQWKNSSIMKFLRKSFNRNIIKTYM